MLRTTWKSKGEEGTFDLEGVDCWARRFGVVVLEGLMSVKPRRRADDGAAIVGWTLDGCISDIGGLISDAAEGVWGGRIGEDMATLGLWVSSITGLSSRSATESSLGEVDAFAGVCDALWSVGSTAASLQGAFVGFVYLLGRH